MSQTELFEKALSRYEAVDGLVTDVREALTGSDAPLTSAVAQVAAFHIAPTDQVWACYVVDDRRLLVHERTRDGRTLTVSVPLRRVSRVVIATSPGSTGVTIELDADQLTVSEQTEWLEGDSEDNPGQRQGRQVSQGTLRRAGYVLTVNADDDAAHAALRRFGATLGRLAG